MVNEWKRIAQIPTFADACGSPDLKAVRAAASRLYVAGWQTIAVAGFHGSYLTLSAREQLELIQAAREGAPGAVIAAGAFDASTEKAVERIREHSAAGCHVHLCTGAYYFSNNAKEEWYRHFDRLLGADPEGQLIIVDCKALCGYQLPEDVLTRLAADPRVICVLLTDSAPTRVAHLSARIPVILPDELALTVKQEGGLMSRLACLYPQAMLKPDALSPTQVQALLRLAGDPYECGILCAAKVLGLVEADQPVAPLRGSCDADAMLQAMEALKGVQ